MNTLAEFIVDEKEHSLLINKTFNAPLEKVWKAWTSAENLDKWWAPKPYFVQTKAMYFRAGGMWLYAMVGPQDEKHYSRADYKTINLQQSLIFTDAFCNEEGKVNTEKPTCTWHVNFLATSYNITTVTINVNCKSSADLAEMLNMCFKEGFTMSLENLAAFLVD